MNELVILRQMVNRLVPLGKNRTDFSTFLG